MAVLADRFGRTFPYLRLSVIEACNFSCSYCLPDGYQARPAADEPSLRKDLAAIIRIAASTPGVDKVALTTNGCLLRKKFSEWQDAGLPAVKLNAVLLRDLNDDQLPAWLSYLQERPVSLRFIELMQSGSNLAYFKQHHYRAEALEQQLQSAGWQPPRATAAHACAPASAARN